jgi:hypothetical protein
LDNNGKDSGMQRQPKPLFLAVVMALLMALALVGTAGAAGDASGESAGDRTGSSQTTPRQSSDDHTSSGKTSTATEDAASDDHRSSGKTSTATEDAASDDHRSSGKTSTATETTHPRELPTTGTGGELQPRAAVDLRGFALIGLAFGGLALLAGGLAVRKVTR